jgi:hypothetical protein
VPAWRLLLRHRVPRRLGHDVIGASGRNDLFCWRMGEGPFTPGPLTELLAFRPDPINPFRHGFVEPANEMPLAEYQDALAATKDQWVIDEA